MPVFLRQLLHTPARRQATHDAGAKVAKPDRLCSSRCCRGGLADVRAPFVNVRVGERGRSQVHFGAES